MISLDSTAFERWHVRKLIINTCLGLLLVFGFVSVLALGSFLEDATSDTKEYRRSQLLSWAKDNCAREFIPMRARGMVPFYRCSHIMQDAEYTQVYIMGINYEGYPYTWYVREGKAGVRAHKMSMHSYRQIPLECLRITKLAPDMPACSTAKYGREAFELTVADVFWQYGPPPRQ